MPPGGLQAEEGTRDDKAESGMRF